jgi:glycine/D-amino acid oxidase-like deaminating enzyme
MSRSYDVIFIGGGIMGCSCALESAKRGLDVAVVEKQTIGEGPTGQSSAILRTHYSNELTARMARYGLAYYRDFREHTGDECGFHRTGFLMLAAQADHAGLAHNLALLKRLGVQTEALEPAEVGELMPGLEIGEGAAPLVVAWEPDSGHADGYLAVTGMARAARRLGVDVLQDTEVTGVSFAGERVSGVETSAGRLEAPLVVNTAGAWGARVAAMAGLELPIDACRVQVAFFRRPAAEAQGHPVVADFVHASYFRPDTGGLTLAGLIDPGEADAVVDPDDFARKVDLRFQADVGERLSRRYPAMSASASEGGYASLYAITPDWHPIVDEVPRGGGFYVCSGFSGHGFKLAPAVGVMVADMLTGVSSPEFDPALFRLSRFEEGAPVGGEYEYSIVG